jgi:hypothetical protein
MSNTLLMNWTTNIHQHGKGNMVTTVLELICLGYTLLLTMLIILSSDNTASMEGNVVAGREAHMEKRKASSLISESQQRRNPNNKPWKERQPNWSSLEVMALIHANEKEHAATKLTSNARDHMEMAIVKWARIADDVEKVGLSQYYQGP